MEYQIYKRLKGCEGIPKICFFGREGDYNVLVMELLGPNLEDLFGFCKNRLTIKSVCMLAY